MTTSLGQPVAQPDPSGKADHHLPPLAVITSVDGAQDGDRLVLDRKALEGIEYRARHWPGPVYWLLTLRDAPSTYSVSLDPADLPFTVIDIAPDRSDVAAKLPAGALLEASGDDPRDLGLAPALPGRVLYIIEYTLRTRFDILRVDKVGLLRKIRRAIWELGCERRRKRAMRASAGLLCNGLPAYRAFGSLAPRAIAFFDTRLTDAMQIDAATLAAKQAGIRGGGPLRLAYSGRLERMKGAHHLVPLARRLQAAGVDFVLDLFGSGALLPEIERAAASDLAGRLVPHGPVPFAEALVPAMRERVDLFLCPHPQGDPSCTYMETLGCGVPIAGFANEAWAAMLEGQSFGVQVPVDDVAALADAVIALDRDRERLADMAGAAATFSGGRTFEHAFADRLALLRDIAGTR